MTPTEVDDLEAWVRWYYRLLAEVGAFDAHLDVADMELSSYLDGREQRGIDIPEIEHTLPDGRRLSVACAVYSLTSMDGDEVEFNQQTYSYGLMEADGTNIVRYDCHSADHHNLGTLHHVHRGPDETVAAHHEMDLGDVVYVLRTDGLIP